MRIIAGSARGRHILAPEGMETRPTLERVKESFFGTIQFEIAGRAVLDLFAGSGNLGIEALSRGADFAYFCDVKRSCTELISQNLKKLGFEDDSYVGCGDYADFVRTLKTKNAKIGLVFLDPPYASELAQNACDLLCAEDVLTDDALIVAEHSVRQEIVPPEGVCVRSRKTYRDTAVTILTRVNDAEKGVK